MTYTLTADAGAFVLTGQVARRAPSGYCSISSTALWFPVAPGVTSLPAAPVEVVNAVPLAPNQATLPPDWDDAAPDLCYLFQDILPTGQPPVFPTEQTVTYLHPAANETVPLLGLTRAVLAVGDFPYSLTVEPSTVALVTRAQVSVIVGILDGEAGAVALAGQDATIRLVISLEADAGDYQLLGEDVNLYSTAPTYTLACDAGAFSLTGQIAGPFRLFADLGRYELQGMNITSLAEKTKLILHFDGTSGSTFFENQAQTNKLTAEVYGSAAIATDYVKWGTGSGRFSFPSNYTGHAVAFDDEVLAPGTDDFTIECWVYMSMSFPIYDGRIAKVPGQTGSDGTLYATHTGTAAKLQWQRYVSGADNNIDFGLTMPYDQWVHVWLARQNGLMKAAVDGTLSTSTKTDTTNYDYSPSYTASRRKFIIGNYSVGDTYGFGGRIDDLRYTVGTARTLAVPTGPYPNE